MMRRRQSRIRFACMFLLLVVVACLFNCCLSICLYIQHTTFPTLLFLLISSLLEFRNHRKLNLANIGDSHILAIPPGSSFDTLLSPTETCRDLPRLTETKSVNDRNGCNVCHIPAWTVYMTMSICKLESYLPVRTS